VVQIGKFQNASPPSIFELFGIFLDIWIAYGNIQKIEDFF